MNGFKKCPNGHYYKDDLLNCPYCRSTGAPNSSSETVIVGDASFSGAPQPAGNSSSETVIIEGADFSAVGHNPGAGNTASHNPQDAPTVQFGFPERGMRSASSSEHTMFGDEVLEMMDDGRSKRVIQERNSRRLVGWLVTYSFDPMGTDFRLFEGRNTVGRSMDCNITVNDTFMTGKHATILFKNNRYKVRDELSTHGTYVNGIDIDDEPYELNDGDEIKMGNTLFLFRKSIK